MNKNKTTIRQASSPESLAKTKNVPATLKKNKGVYVLVSVVEGEIPNRQLVSNLNLVSAQRRELVTISTKYQRLPETSIQERELYAGQINQLKKKLTNNLKEMAKAYGYSLKNEYMLVPHLAVLRLKDDKTGKLNPAPVYTFEDNNSYEEFQTLRRKYSLHKGELLKLQKMDDDESADDDEKSGKKKDSEDQMKQIADELQAKFKCDAEKHYELSLVKSALYALPVSK